MEDKSMTVMNVVEKRDLIHSHLHRAAENTIDEFYEKLRKENVLKAKLENRALISEKDIQSGRIFSKEEIKERTV
ncbi:MAG: hypothetical protein LC658_07000, partial [Bacteroidales bacterium]|nr:hypothetical protein [Bacteroidales bacterium]